MRDGLTLMEVRGGALAQNVDLDLGVIRREVVLLVVTASVQSLFKLADEPAIANDPSALDVAPGQSLELPVEGNGRMRAHGFTAVAAGGHISLALFRRRFDAATDAAPL